MPLNIKAWTLAFACTVIGCAVSIAWLDLPIAQFVLNGARLLHPVGDALGSEVLVSLITVTIAPLLIERLMKGSLSRFKETLIVSGCSALASFTVNDFVLKRIFGRLDVVDYLARPQGSGFSLFGGDMYSSFPSGHSVMAAAALLVFARVYPERKPLVVALLCTVAILLILGDWHFLSDVIAGLFLGAFAGVVAGDLAKSHFEKRAAPDKY